MASTIPASLPRRLKIRQLDETVLSAVLLTKVSRETKMIPDSGPEHTSLPAAGPTCTKNMHNSALPSQPQLSLFQNMTVKGVSSVVTPWVPGTGGPYLRPKGATSSDAQATAFPIWNLHEKGKGWQQAIFLATDRLEQTQRESAIAQEMQPESFAAILRSM